MIVWQILVVGSSAAAELSSFVAAIVGVHAPAMSVVYMGA